MTSAFGKVILLGEHAVVHGRPALACAINRLVVCRFEGRAEGPISLSVPHWNVKVKVGEQSPLAQALEVVARGTGADHLSIDLHAVAELPPAAGLGSSAAMMVAVTRALAAAAGRQLDPATIERIATDGERLFHEKPSGIDVALAANGGVGLFQRERGLEVISAEPFELIVALSGESRRTGDMVRAVAERLESDPDATGALLDEMGDAAEQSAADIASGNLAALGPRMNRAQDILRQLGLSTRAIDALCQVAVRAGAVGAKLTGAGGGGAVIALCPDNPEQVVSAMRALGREAFTVTAGVIP